MMIISIQHKKNGKIRKAEKKERNKNYLLISPYKNKHCSYLSVYTLNNCLGIHNR